MGVLTKIVTGVASRPWDIRSLDRRERKSYRGPAIARNAKIAKTAEIEPQNLADQCHQCLSVVRLAFPMSRLPDLPITRFLLQRLLLFLQARFFHLRDRNM